MNSKRTAPGAHWVEWLDGTAPDLFDRIREREFARLDRSHTAYLDYTGAALYAESHVRSHAAFLTGATLGNPHSDSPVSTRATELVDEARAAVLASFEADPGEYDVCFTANASGAFRLVGEAYPFEAGSRLVLSADNHNSVNGIREFARRGGATVAYLPVDDALRVPAFPRGLPEPGPGPSLLAFPAQSNFSGVLHPLATVDRARRLGYDVLLDAAAFAPTHRLNLSRVRPAFVAVSFYKMFGYPTGVGALVATHEALARLRRPWFAGGTVAFASVQNRLHRFLGGGERFEDGTTNFLAIAAVPEGLQFLAEIGIERVTEHVARHTERTLDMLRSLRHEDGRPMIRMYGPPDVASRGGAVAFNVVDGTGRVVPYEEVERRCGRFGVAVRGGCFCNPGASEAAFGIEAGAAGAYLRAVSGRDFTPDDFARATGAEAVGAVRASFGIPTADRDVDRFRDAIRSFRDAPAPRHGYASVASR